MIEHMTPDRVANAICMDSNSHKYYLLTEGEKDTLLFSKFINKETIEIRPVFGCSKLLECFNILKHREFNRYIGVIDGDFHRILGTVPEIENLFLVDFHDIEIMMIKSSALNNIVNISGYGSKVKEFEKDKNIALLNALLNSAKNIGYLRLANNIHSLGLKFKPDKPEGNQIPYKDFICDDLVFRSCETMIKRIIDYSRNKNVNLKSEVDIKEKFFEVSKNEYDIDQLVNGHDITNILSMFFVKKIKCKKSMVADHNAITDSLILAFETTEFQKTNLYKELKKWSGKNGIVLFA